MQEGLPKNPQPLTQSLGITGVSLDSDISLSLSLYNYTSIGIMFSVGKVSVLRSRADGRRKYLTDLFLGVACFRKKELMEVIRGQIWKRVMFNLEGGG